jgi:hypothetical protein
MMKERRVSNVWAIALYRVFTKEDAERYLLDISLLTDEYDDILDRECEDIERMIDKSPCK